MMELKQLGLSLRTYNCLKRARIDTVEQLSGMSDEDLLRIRGFGNWCLREVRHKVPTPAMTNVDRIRAMSDEELAAYWASNCDGFCRNRPECSEALDKDGVIPDEWCVACALAWLRQPAEDA